MNGTPDQASTYCKKDGDFTEHGKLPDDPKTSLSKAQSKGGKATAEKYRKIINLAEGHNLKQIRDEHPSEYLRYYHTCKRIAMDNPPVLSDLNELDNEWIWGAPGLGKSRIARLENPGCYVKSHNKWFLGYKDEDVVLYDDLDKSEGSWIGPFLKAWADHYPFPSETKGDGAMLRPKRIIVTSNYSIEDVFTDNELQEAIKRRFKVRHIIQPFKFPVPVVATPVVPIDAIDMDPDEIYSDTESSKEQSYDEDIEDLYS